METLVLPAQDQLSQHQYWQKRNVLDHLFSPRSTPPRSRKPDPLLAPSKSYMSSTPSSPVYRSIHRTTSADFSSSLAHSSLPGSSTEVTRPSTASGGRAAPKGRASPVKKSFENASKGNKGQGNKATYMGKPSKSKTPNLPNGKISESSGLNGSSSRDMSVKAKPKSGFAKKTERNGSYQKKEGDAGSPPKITILPRPQTKEAAMLDLAKITGLPLSEVYAKNGLFVPEQNAKVEHKPEPVKTKSTRVRANRAENKLSSPPPEAEVLELREVKVNNNKVGVEETTTTRTATAAGTIKAEEDVLGPFTRNFGEAFLPPPLFDEKWAEKWAGPAFTNSPPPSSLPIPNFPLMKKTEIVAQVEFARIDTEAATKGLRRILNLDF